MASIAITINQKDLARLEKSISHRLPESLGDSMERFGNHLVSRLKINLLNDPLRPAPTPNRMSASELIRQKRMTKQRSHITMPRSLIFLDAMQPHFVSLKRGRNITAWAKKNYGNLTVAGKSRVRQTSKGGIKGFIYVTPHKFVQKSLVESIKILPNELRKGVKKAFKSSSMTG